MTASKQGRLKERAEKIVPVSHVYFRLKEDWPKNREIFIGQIETALRKAVAEFADEAAKIADEMSYVSEDANGCMAIYESIKKLKESYVGK